VVILKKKEKRKVALLIEASVVLLFRTIKYGINPKKIKSVKGNGKGGKEIPRMIPLRISISCSFLLSFF
jgi:hypothetical protein